MLKQSSIFEVFIFWLSSPPAARYYTSLASKTAGNESGVVNLWQLILYLGALDQPLIGLAGLRVVADSSAGQLLFAKLQKRSRRWCLSPDKLWHSLTAATQSNNFHHVTHHFVITDDKTVWKRVTAQRQRGVVWGWIDEVWAWHMRMWKRDVFLI